MRAIDETVSMRGSGKLKIFNFEEVTALLDNNEDQGRPAGRPRISMPQFNDI